MRGVVEPRGDNRWRVRRPAAKGAESAGYRGQPSALSDKRAGRAGQVGYGG